jgi:hypothetical protein
VCSGTACRSAANGGGLAVRRNISAASATALMVLPIPDHPINRAVLKLIELVGHVPPLIGEFPERMGKQPITRLTSHVVALICFRLHFAQPIA